jgi:hypothetical protein
LFVRDSQVERFNCYKLFYMLGELKEDVVVQGGRESGALVKADGNKGDTKGDTKGDKNKGSGTQKTARSVRVTALTRQQLREVGVGEVS